MSLGLAAGYVAALVGVYWLFVRWYRASKAKTVSNTIEPWFEEGHPARVAYEQLYDSLPDDLTPKHVQQLKGALMKRAVINVQRVFSLREDRSTLALLLRNGAIGDDLWEEFTSAETDLNKEIQETVREAEELEKGWGNTIFQEATQQLAQAQQREMEEARRMMERRAAMARAAQEQAAKEQAAAESD
ncbi:translocation protein S66 [Allomyces javanicus]|nr:translocation protein S66 [Allomyces javanicus]